MIQKPDPDKLLNDIKDAEAKLRGFLLNLGTMRADLEKLKKFETQILSNISYLKNSPVAVSASEYRAIKSNLVDVKSKISKINIDHQNIIKMMKDIEVYIQKNKQAYSASIIGPNNVLPFRSLKWTKKK